MELGPLFEAGYQAYEIVREAAKLEIEIMEDYTAKERQASEWYDEELAALKRIVELYSKDYYVNEWDK